MNDDNININNNNNNTTTTTNNDNTTTDDDNFTDNEEESEESLESEDIYVKSPSVHALGFKDTDPSTLSFKFFSRRGSITTSLGKYNNSSLTQLSQNYNSVLQIQNENLTDNFSYSNSINNNNRNKFFRMINNINNRFNLFKKPKQEKEAIHVNDLSNNQQQQQQDDFVEITDLGDKREAKKNLDSKRLDYKKSKISQEPNSGETYEEYDDVEREIKELNKYKKIKTSKNNSLSTTNFEAENLDKIVKLNNTESDSDSDTNSNMLVETIKGFHSDLFHSTANSKLGKHSGPESSNSNIKRSISEPGKSDDKQTSSGPKKQLQFNLDNVSPKSDSTKNANYDKRLSSINLQEKLNQLKADAIKSKRFTSGSSTRRRKSRGSVNYCDPKTLKETIMNTKSFFYKILERPVGHLGFAYRVFSFSIIMGSIIIGSLTTLDSDEFTWSSSCLFWYELAASIYFSIEYLLRVWSAGYREQYVGIFGRIKFMRRPMHVIELLVIIINIILISNGVKVKDDESTIYSDVIFYPNYLVALRFFQILRFLYVDRHAQSWILLMKVVYKHRFELLTSVYIGVIILLFSSYLILIFEKDYTEKNNDDQFKSFADAMYWSIITMTTIGYGDRSPRTFEGKIIATSLCILGVAFWTLPGGIIGSGFALKVEQKNKKKQFNRLLPASATLIQAWWRVKATENLSARYASLLIATVKTFDISKPIISLSLRRLKSHLEGSGVNELNTIFAGLDSVYQDESIKPTTSKNSQNDQKESISNFQDDLPNIQEADYPLLKSDGSASSGRINSNINNKSLTHLSSHSSTTSQSNNEESSILMSLSPEHLILIRTILLLKLFVAKHKFKLAFKPYDFKDVIEQYTQGNMDIMLKIKDLQRKLEQVTTTNTMINSQNRYIQYAGTNFANIQNSSLDQPIPGSPAFSRSPNISKRTLSSPAPARLSPTPSQTKSNGSKDYYAPVVPSSFYAPSKLTRKSSKSVLVGYYEQQPLSAFSPLNNSTMLQSQSSANNHYSNERLNKIEADMHELSKKLDKLIQITTTKTPPSTITNNNTSNSNDAKLKFDIERADSQSTDSNDQNNSVFLN